MAKITVKELYYGERYGVMGEVFKAMLLVPDKTVDEQTRLELEIVRQTLIASEKMKQNGDCIAESDLGSAAAVFESGGEGNGEYFGGTLAWKRCAIWQCAAHARDDAVDGVHRSASRKANKQSYRGIKRNL